jgi:hypothetical protein
MAKPIIWSTFPQGGKALENSSIKTSEDLLNELKIQARGSLAPYGLSSP